MSNNPSKSSGSEQEKKKVCIVCFDCEVVILDLESDLKDVCEQLVQYPDIDDDDEQLVDDDDEQLVDEDDVEQLVDDDDDEQLVDYDVVEQLVDGDDVEQLVDDDDDEQVDDDPLVVLNPVARLDYDLLGIHTFCRLGSKLYMFEDGYTGIDSDFCIVTKDELKSAYAYDLSSSSSEVVTLLGENSVHKIKDMWGPKAWPLAAAPTPDGTIIVVFSSMIQYDIRDKDNPKKMIDFELYDTDLDQWFILPGLTEKVVEKGGITGPQDKFDIDAFFFVTNSEMLVYIGTFGFWFLLELDNNHGGEWRGVDLLHVGGDGYLSNLACLPECAEPQRVVFGGRICMSPNSAFDIRTGKIFHLPYLKFRNPNICFSSVHVTLLCGVSGGELCEFARVHMGKCMKTHLRHIFVDVLTFNLDTYIKQDMAGPARLGVKLVKHSEFILASSKQRDDFCSYNVFPTLAGISSKHSSSVFRGPSVPFRPDPVGKGLKILLDL